MQYLTRLLTHRSAEGAVIPRRAHRSGGSLRAGLAWSIGLAAALGGCAGQSAQSSAPAIGDPDQGRVIIGRQACGSCHVIPGIARADGRVGPPLTAMGSRALIAGILPNTPRQMVRWLRWPQSIKPGDGMPDLGLSEQQARDVAAYLYTLRRDP